MTQRGSSAILGGTINILSNVKPFGTLYSRKCNCFYLLNWPSGNVLGIEKCITEIFRLGKVLDKRFLWITAKRNASMIHTGRSPNYCIPDNFVYS
jgi:hypothetical protein